MAPRLLTAAAVAVLCVLLSLFALSALLPLLLPMPTWHGLIESSRRTVFLPARHSPASPSGRLSENLASGSSSSRSTSATRVGGDRNAIGGGSARSEESAGFHGGIWREDGNTFQHQPFADAADRRDREETAIGAMLASERALRHTAERMLLQWINPPSQWQQVLQQHIAQLKHETERAEEGEGRYMEGLFQDMSLSDMHRAADEYAANVRGELESNPLLKSCHDDQLFGPTDWRLQLASHQQHALLQQQQQHQRQQQNFLRMRQKRIAAAIAAAAARRAGATAAAAASAATAASAVPGESGEGNTTSHSQDASVDDVRARVSESAVGAGAAAEAAGAVASSATEAVPTLSPAEQWRKRWLDMRSSAAFRLSRALARMARPRVQACLRLSRRFFRLQQLLQAEVHRWRVRWATAANAPLLRAQQRTFLYGRAGKPSASHGAHGDTHGDAHDDTLDDEPGLGDDVQPQQGMDGTKDEGTEYGRHADAIRASACAIAGELAARCGGLTSHMTSRDVCGAGLSSVPFFLKHSCASGSSTTTTRRGNFVGSSSTADGISRGGEASEVEGVDAQRLSRFSVPSYHWRRSDSNPVRPRADVTLAVQHYKHPDGIFPYLVNTGNCSFGYRGKGAELPEGTRVELVANVDEVTSWREWMEVWRKGRDNSGSLVRAVFSHNLHETRGYWRLSRFAQGKIMFLLQDDDIPPERCEWVRRALVFFQKRPRLGALGYKYGNWHPLADPTVVGSPWRSPVRWYDRRTSLGSVVASVVDFAPIALPREVFLQVGGLDQAWSGRGTSQIFADWDLTMRVWLAGYEVLYIHQTPEMMQRISEIEASTHTMTLSGAWRVWNERINRLFFSAVVGSYIAAVTEEMKRVGADWFLPVDPWVDVM